MAEMEEGTADNQARDSSFGTGAKEARGKANPCCFDESEFGQILRILAERESPDYEAAERLNADRRKLSADFRKWW